MKPSDKQILVVSTGHKDFLSPLEASRIIANGFSQVFPSNQIQIAPMADGGDGAIDSLVHAYDGKQIHVEVHDPLFRKRQAKIGIIQPNGIQTAVIEIAEAAGSAILKPEERRTMTATSYGVGEMILEAYQKGCQRIIVGLGGSIVSDAGLGMAQALGVKFNITSDTGLHALNLPQIKSIDFSDLKIDLSSVEILVASDVDIPLLGEQGQAKTFGPQKGATADEIDFLESGFAHLTQTIKQDCSRDINVPLAGAAGGLGAGLYGFLNAKLYLGAELIAQEIDLKQKISQADIIVVGEGCLDASTAHNKAPFYIGHLAQSLKKPVIMIAGIRKPPCPTDFYDEIFVCQDDLSSLKDIQKADVEQKLYETAQKAALKLEG